MDARKLFVFTLLATLVLVQPVHRLVAAPGALPLSIGLGFSQGDVQPVTSGIPVYTIGDELWFKVYGANVVNVTIIAPESAGGVESGVVFQPNIPGNTSVELLMFSGGDPTGLWQLTASNSTQEVQVRFSLVSGGASAVLSGYGLGQDGQLLMNYTLDSTTAYDLTACVGGTQSNSTAHVPVPSSLGGGTLLLTLNGTTVSVIPKGGAGTFTFWLGLSQDYAYQLNDTSTVVSRGMEVARTEPAQVSGILTKAFSTALVDELPMRAGQFILGTSFESAQGVTVQDTSVLITGTGQWVWLNGCASSTGVLSNTVSLSASLKNSPSTWPRYVYMLYKELGVSVFSVAPVTIEPAAVKINAANWGALLTDSQVEVSGVSQYAVGNGTIYLLAIQYPVQLSVATPQTAPQEVVVAQPYSVSQVQVPADQVLVKTVSGDNPLSGAVVTLRDSNGTVSQAVSLNGEAVFYVPPGNYTAVGTFGGAAQTSDFAAGYSSGIGLSLRVTLQFGGGSDGTLSYLLLAMLGIGIVASGAVWATAYRRRTKVSNK